MHRFYSLLIIFLYAGIFAQSKIIVKEASTGNPISKAEISCNGEKIGYTNTAGELDFNTKCQMVKIVFYGYYNEDAMVDDIMEVVMTKVENRTQNIETVIIKNKSDEKALAVLDKVNENYEINSPKSLPSYSYKSYEKISIDIDEDSLKHYNQSLGEMMKFMDRYSLKKQKETDSNTTIKNVFANSKLFLWERAQEFLYSKKYGEKINVLDSRIAGLSQPLYEMMAIQSNRNKIPKEILKKNRNIYRYFLTDSLEIDGRMNYVIRFREVTYKKTIQNRLYNGYLYIDTETFGLKKIESNSKNASEGSITSIWKYYNGKWFLDAENIKMKLTNMQMQTKEQKKTEEIKKNRTADSFSSYGFVISKYFEQQTPIDEDPKDFSGYTFSVKNSDGNQLEKYRTEQLSPREKNTYWVIDSLGRKYNFDQKAKSLTSLTRGKLRWKKIDFDLSRLIGYNLHEGFRMGIAPKFNEQFHQYISPDAFVAFGFKDGKVKYGFGIDVKTTLEKNSYFRAEYFHDVMVAGRFSENSWDFRMKLNNAGIAMNNNRFYLFEGAKLSFENDLTNTLEMRISARKQKESALFSYNFKNMGDYFDNFSTTLSLQYSPFSKNIMTPTGKFTIEKKLPEFFFNFEKGFRAIGGDWEYSKFDVLVNHSFQSKLGVTGIRLYGGLLEGEVPIWHHFTMNGLSGNGNLKFNLTSYIGFATMNSGMFYNNKFVGNYITQRIPWYFKSIGQNISSFDLIHRSIIGDMKNPEYHHFEFQKLDHLYQEVGLEWNNFLSSWFNLGVFYRLGYYNTPKFSDNFAVQLKFKLLGF